jgi:ubiquinone/menaquinone biosynthesis C-methylase UbiE
MNTTWSDCIQGIDTLYLTRMLRFSDVFREKYQKAFQIDGRKDILEIGCGPGALCQSLNRWYPEANIYGIDRDSKFIEFARQKAPCIVFSEDDATSLSFEDERFDVTISNTVQEHIEPAGFFGEQYRVLKKGGVCLVLSARKGINISAPCILEKTEFERDFYRRTDEACEKALKEYDICSYPMNEAELPLEMAKYGFQNISTEFITVNLTPDNPEYSAEMAHAMINANRRSVLNSIENLRRIIPGMVTEDEIETLKKIKNEKYDRRISLYDAGIKQWDTNMSLIMVLRGTK